MMRLVRTTVIGVSLCAVLLVTGCGDDDDDSGDASSEQTDAAEVVELSDEFCEAWGDPVWVEFTNAPEKTEEQAAMIEELAAQMEANAPEELAEEVEIAVAGAEGFVAVYRDAGFDASAVDVGELTDLSQESVDAVTRLAFAAKESCGIELNQGGPFATGSTPPTG
jgi:hypothetical protein